MLLRVGQRIYYNAGSSGGRGTSDQAVELFCTGGDLVSSNPAKAFQSTLQAAQAGYVPAQEVVGMMYAVGQGVRRVSSLRYGVYHRRRFPGGDVWRSRKFEVHGTRWTESAAKWAELAASRFFFFYERLNRVICERSRV